MNFRTIYDLNHLINEKIHMVPLDVDLIVGIPRSGMLPANIIALYRNIPLTDIDSFLDDRIYAIGETKKADWITEISQARKILVVEDSSLSGTSILKAKNQLSSNRYTDKLLYLSVYVTDETKKLVDIYFEQCNLPRMFEWNYLHHMGVANACFDMDGVLCVDPTDAENDDGKNYEEFIKNAVPRVIPTNKIGMIVTSRLEKYRKQTEEWLEKNNIEYGELVMMQYASKEERLAAGQHGVFKGEVYKKSNAEIFVESNSAQAEAIAKVSGKMVFCVGNQMVYGESTWTRMVNDSQRLVKKILKCVLPDSMIRYIKEKRSSRV